jgi:hypothetical protein
LRDWVPPVTVLRPTVLAAVAFAGILLGASLPTTNAHPHNFENRGELCGVAPGAYSPHGHSDTDGHAHWHHVAPAAAAHDHWDPATQTAKTYPAGHDHPWWHTAAATSAHDHFNADPAVFAFQTHAVGHGHASPLHDPCLQTRMDYPYYLDAAEIPLDEVEPPLVALDPLATLYPAPGAGRSRVYAGGEAYEFPVKLSDWKVVQNFVVSSDLQAAGMGFPGDGSRQNPYIVQGYIVKGNMVFKDTSKCFVVKNNVVVNRVIPGRPIVDLPDIPLEEVFNFTWEKLNTTLGQVDNTVNGTLQAVRQVLNGNPLVSLDALASGYQKASLQAQEMRNGANAQKATEDTAQAARDTAKAAMEQERADWDAQDADWEARLAAWQATLDQYARDYFIVLQETERLADDFETYANQYTTPVQPTRGHSTYVDYANSIVSDLSSIDGAFVPYQQEDTQPSTDNVEGWIAGNPPPQNPPPGWPGTAQDWQYEVQAYSGFQDGITALIAGYWDLRDTAPSLAAYNQFLADKAAFEANYTAFLGELDAFMDQYAEDLAAYQRFLQWHAWVVSFTQSVFTEVNAFLAQAAQFDFQYKGVRGSKLFNTLEELFRWVIKLLLNILDGLDINEPARNTGQLTFDWNGQCVHAYNNVAYDLRVNQNNDRTGFATGGILEQNRFYTIGQIRHYDGIFRNNEVGNRAFLHQLVKPGVVPLASSARAINNDGANQGWYYGNTIYGNVDLDFHGHHHSPGFFAPQSHYHGSTRSIAYMQTATGTCTGTQASVNSQRATGPHKDYPSDNDVHAFHNVVVAQADPAGCLPHFDHGKRWTSVFFNDNLVIDPNGVGLRFEDQAHRADDEQANSENMRELKKPHYHQKWVQMERNTIVGKMFVDILNAQGTLLWNDNWAAVAKSSGPARTQEALGHPGAEIVTSHPYRNDAWLDIQDNTILVTQSQGVLVSDAEDLTLMQLKDNRGFAFPKAYTLTPALDTPAEFLDWLEGLQGATTADIASAIDGIGGQDRGVQSLATLANLRDRFRVEHCGNTVDGLDFAITAKDRIYNDSYSIIQACSEGTAGPNDIAYTLYVPPPTRCTEEYRDFASGTDDFYVSEYAFDVTDTAAPAAVCPYLTPPVPPPGPAAVADPVQYANDASASAVAYVMGLI